MIRATLRTHPDPVAELDDLKVAVKKRILKKAIRAGVKDIVRDVRAKVAVRSGALKKSIASKVDSKRDGSVTFGVVGPRGSFTMAVGKRVVKPSRYAHFLEIGRHARPFLVPAWASGKARYVSTVQGIVLDEITKQLGAN